MTTKLLKCKCGDCAHWEVVQTTEKWEGVTSIPKTHLKCVTCGVEYAATITVDPHEKLHYVNHKA